MLSHMMRIGGSTLINPINDMPEILHFYFKFGNYQKIKEICDKKNETTDYCGILQSPIQDKSKRDGEPFVSFNLIDSGLEADDFGKNLTGVVNTGLPSYTKFLTTNPIYTICLNFCTIRTNFSDFGNTNQHLQINTISDLLERPPSDLQGIMFSCDAKIQQVTLEVQRYRNICRHAHTKSSNTDRNGSALQTVNLNNPYTCTKSPHYLKTTPANCMSLSIMKLQPHSSALNVTN